MGIFLFAPAGPGREAAEACGKAGGAPLGPAQDEAAGRVAARRPLPVCERNSRRLTAFFLERAFIPCAPRRKLPLTFTSRWNYTPLRDRSKRRNRSRKSFY